MMDLSRNMHFVFFIPRTALLGLGATYAAIFILLLILLPIVVLVIIMFILPHSLWGRWGVALVNGFLLLFVIFTERVLNAIIESFSITRSMMGI